METLLNTTTSLCATCKRGVEASLYRVDGQVVMRKNCPQHGAAQVLISSNADWYQEMMGYSPTLVAPIGAHAVSQGCPFDCGPCTQHEQRTLLPIVPITSSCNLDCPICYTHNRNDSAYHMSPTELRAILGHLQKADPHKRIINITGGEPTLHPQFEQLLTLCRDEGIHRITVSTHGLQFLKDPSLVEKLARLQARVVLSFDSFEKSTNVTMLGGAFADAKMRVLDLLERHGVDTTLLPVLARGFNDHEVGKLVNLALSRDFIRSLELHTMTFTGQGGSTFDRAARYTTYDVLHDIEQQTQGALRVGDFFPSPAAHSLCYLVTYVLRLDDGRWLPFTRFARKEAFRQALGGALYLEPTREVEESLEDTLNRVWSGEVQGDDAPLVLSTLKGLLRRMFSPENTPAERMRAAEQSSKAIYVHAHMDEETFDTDRIRQCCVGIREPDGRNIPSCAYNVLYRNRDARFMGAPGPALVTLGRGRREAP